MIWKSKGLCSGCGDIAPAFEHRFEAGAGEDDRCEVIKGLVDGWWVLQYVVVMVVLKYVVRYRRKQRCRPEQGMRRYGVGEGGEGLPEPGKYESAAASSGSLLSAVVCETLFSLIWPLLIVIWCGVWCVVLELCCGARSSGLRH